MAHPTDLYQEDRPDVGATPPEAVSQRHPGTLDRVEKIKSYLESSTEFERNGARELDRWRDHVRGLGRLTVRRKITIVLVVVAFLPLLVSTLTSYVQQRDQVIAREKSHLAALASFQEARVDAHTDRLFEGLSSISSRTDLRELLAAHLDSGGVDEQEQMNAVLANVQNSFSDFRSISVLTTAGVVVASTDVDAVGSAITDAEVLWASGLPSVATIGSGGGSQHQILHGPIHVDDDAVGFVLIEASIDPLIELTSDYTGLGLTGETLLATRDSDGNSHFITPRRGESEGPMTLMPAGSAGSAIDRALNGTQAVMDDTVDYRGEPVLAATRFIEELGWGLVVKIDQEETLASVNDVRDFLIFNLLVGAAVIAIFVFFVPRWISEPVVELTETAVAISEGDLDRRANPGSNDELGTLGAAFNRMTDSLTDSNAELVGRQRALESSEQQFRQAFENAPVGMALVTLQGDFREVNEAFAELVGYSRHELLAMHWLTLSDPSETKEIADAVAGILQSGQPSVTLERKLRRADGEVLTTRGSVSVVRDPDGNPQHFIVQLVDITPLMDSQSQLEELVRSKDELVASISHELRTPLTAVVGFAQLLQQERTTMSDEERTELIRVIRDEGTDLANIVDDLLAAAKAESGTLTVVEVPIALRAQVAQVLETLDSEAAAQIEITGEPGRALGDPSRVRQILRNLVSNAFKYGGDTVRIEFSDDEVFARVAVADDGPPIPAEDRARIFEAYQRAHNAPGLTASMGLGLAISRELAQRMRGDLEYRHQDGWSTFELTLRKAPSLD